MALYLAAMYLLGGAFGTYIRGSLSDHFRQQAMLAAGLAIEGARLSPCHTARQVFTLPLYRAHYFAGILASCSLPDRGLSRLMGEAQ
ncbi:MAG: hypothetical protein IPL01_05855 [Acidobacteria bacterium]|nr:hypothetical protein [Acidobacteriota bacterium]